MIRSSRKFLILTIFFITILIIRTKGFINVPLEIKLLILAVVPVYFIWLISKYSKPGKTTKYRIIYISSLGVVFYIIGVSGFLQKYYPITFEKYRHIISILILASLFLNVIVGSICYYLVKMNDDDYGNMIS